MRCVDAQRILTRRLDGEPARSWFGSLDRHLARCPACAAWERDQERLRGALASALPLPPVRDDWQAIARRLSALDPKPATFRDRVGEWWGARPARLAVTMTLFATVAVGLLAGARLGEATWLAVRARPLVCDMPTDAFGDLPAGSPGHGLARLLGGETGRANGGGR